MRLYPAIDIKNGKCVRLKQGNFDEQTVYSNEPADIARKWVDNGASYIHVVDLDGALDGMWVNKSVIKNIVSAVNIPVQTGGGVRNLNDIEDRLKIGIDRVIIGTLAVTNPPFVKEAVAKFGRDKIVVGIDAKDGKVAVNGWGKVSTVLAIDLCKQMKSYGVRTIIYTDISKDGMLLGPNVEYTKYLIEKTDLDIIASGGVAVMDDLIKIREIKAEGVIIGKALYTNSINLRDAVELFEK